MFGLKPHGLFQEQKPWTIPCAAGSVKAGMVMARLGDGASVVGHGRQAVPQNKSDACDSDPDARRYTTPANRHDAASG